MNLYQLIPETVVGHEKHLASIIVIDSSYISIAYFMKDTFVSADLKSSLSDEIKAWVNCTAEGSTDPRKNNYYINQYVDISEMNDEFEPDTGLYSYMGKSVLTFYDIKHHQSYTMYTSGYNAITKEVKNFFSRFPESYNSQLSTKEYMYQNNITQQCSVYIPSLDNGLISDCNSIVLEKTDQQVIVDKTGSLDITIIESADHTQYMDTKKYLPTILIESADIVSSNGSLDFVVKVVPNQWDSEQGKHVPSQTPVNYAMNIVANCSGGYIPVRQKSVLGQSVFSIYADRVEPESMLTLTVGFDSNPLIAQKILTVV